MFCKLRVAAESRFELITIFVQGMFPGDIRVVVVQTFAVSYNGQTFGVGPGSGADAITGIDGVVSLRTQIGPPGVVSGACRLGQRLAVGVRARDSTQVATIAETMLVIKKPISGGSPLCGWATIVSPVNTNAPTVPATAIETRFVFMVVFLPS